MSRKQYWADYYKRNKAKKDAASKAYYRRNKKLVCARQAVRWRRKSEAERKARGLREYQIRKLVEILGYTRAEAKASLGILDAQRGPCFKRVSKDIGANQ